MYPTSYLPAAIDCCPRLKSNGTEAISRVWAWTVAAARTTANANRTKMPIVLRCILPPSGCLVQPLQIKFFSYRLRHLPGGWPRLRLCRASDVPMPRLFAHLHLQQDNLVPFHRTFT